jgi:tetratricopeptide (TPR) repeat protein
MGSSMIAELEKLFANNRFTQLKAACKAALTRDPRAVFTRHVFGLLSSWDGNIEAASEYLSPAITASIQAEGNDCGAEAQESFVWELITSKQPDKALPLVIRRLLHAPLNATALGQAAECLRLQGRHRESAGFLKTLSRLQPEDSETFYRLGMAFVCDRAPADALPFLRKSVELNPDSHLSWRCLAMALLQDSQHEAAVGALEVCIRLQPHNLLSISQQIFSLHYCPPHLQAGLPSAYRLYAGQLPEIPPHALRFCSTEKIRIGYVSGDLREHPVSFFLQPLLASHDTAAFEVFCYSNNAAKDAITDKIRACAGQWREIWQLSNEAFFEQVRKDGIHVLIDLSGHTPMNRLPVFAQRPAPVQITMIGAMLSTGLRSIDFRVTDAFLDPAGGEPHGVETPMRLKSGAVVFSPPEDAPEVSRQPCESGAPFTFASLNDPAKITDETLALWADILREVPAARLLLVRRPGNGLKRKLGALGVSEERILEKDYQPLHEFLKMHGLVDLALDPFPYNGLTVTLQGCWMGVAAVTLLGEAPPSRAAGMIFSKMGLDEFITRTPEEYVRRAVEFARDPQRLARIRSVLRDLTLAAWCDKTAYTREFEEQLRKALADRSRTASPLPA